MNFAIMAKFIPVALQLPWTLQLPNGFIGGGGGGGGGGVGEGGTHFHSTPFISPLSRPFREPPFSALSSSALS